MLLNVTGSVTRAYTAFVGKTGCRVTQKYSDLSVEGNHPKRRRVDQVETDLWCDPRNHCLPLKPRVAACADILYRG